MSVAVVVLAFVAILILIGWIGRGAKLDAIFPRLGERTLYEERSCRVRWYGRSSYVVHPGCRVIVTDRRLLVAQKALLGGWVTLVIVADEPGPDAELAPIVAVWMSSETDITLGRDGKTRFVLLSRPSESRAGVMRIFCKAPGSLVRAYQDRRLDERDPQG
jgi:hypothetical protein